MKCLRFFPRSRFKWIDPTKFDFKYSSNSSEACLLKIILEYPKSYENYTTIMH